MLGPELERQQSRGRPREALVPAVSWLVEQERLLAVRVCAPKTVQSVRRQPNRARGKQATEVR
jgi:hypothetical protein